MNTRVRAIRTGLDRARRRAGLDHNPLRRREDRIQSSVVIILILVFLAASPLAALWAGGRVYDAGLRAERLQLAQRHQVLATVTEPGKASVQSWTRNVQVSWQERDGIVHTGYYQVGLANTGDTTTVWLDRSGHLVPPPREHSHIVVDAVLVGSGAVLSLLVVFLSGYGLLRYRLDRNRDRLWENGWERANVQWGLRGRRPEQP